MNIGINYPWIDYGWDFGDPPSAWVSAENLSSWREQKRRHIEDDFRQFASQGIFAVRWFLLADGMNYGMGEHAPQQAGREWTFDPLPAGHLYYKQLCDDFEFVLQTCAKNGLKFFPSLIDFHWCHQGSSIEGNPRIIKGGRYDIVRDPMKRKVFFERVLDPLLEISMHFRESIYAWELINEPEWVIRKLSLIGKKDVNRNVSIRVMKEFIAEGISRINMKLLPDGRSAFKSSVGFAHWDTLEKWDSIGLGITLHQFHYYAQENCDLPPHTYSDEYPCVVGEFATATERDWPDLTSLQQEQTVANRLRCVEEKGYPACFMWSAKAQDVATSWTANEHREILAFTGATGPDSVA
jgi:hypothetical protein